LVPVSFESTLQQAARTLSRRDPVLRPLIRQHGLPTFRPHDDYFDTLVDAIISQQISGRAAESIMRRFRDAVGGLLAPNIIAEVPDELLRGAGISPQKLGYLRSLCDHVLDNRLRLASLASLSDEEVTGELTEVKGIGVWTAQMFLIFSLGRLDVLPVGDLGVQRGAQILYNLPELPKPKELTQLAEERKWAPYRTVASWYMWRATS
jgi:DNA-3-methyladenine glycosylase II